jgi:hypothetical protein
MLTIATRTNPVGSGLSCFISSRQGEAHGSPPSPFQLGSAPQLGGTNREKRVKTVQNGTKKAKKIKGSPPARVVYTERAGGSSPSPPTNPSKPESINSKVVLLLALHFYLEMRLVDGIVIFASTRFAMHHRQ